MDKGAGGEGGQGVKGATVASYYQSPEWRHLARATKERDHFQCQVCGDREGDPHCQLHAHHIARRSKGGSDTLENLVTVCDLCHATVTGWLYKTWFGSAAAEQNDTLQESRQEFEQFLSLPPDRRLELQRRVWTSFGRH